MRVEVAITRSRVQTLGTLPTPMPCRARSAYMSGRYSRKAIDHFMNPRNLGRLPEATGRGRAVNSAQDVVTFEVVVEDDVVTTARFEAQGCAACIASASVATELIVGQSVTAARSLTDLSTLSDALDGLPAGKLPRAKVTATAIRVALDDHTS